MTNAWKNTQATGDVKAVIPDRQRAARAFYGPGCSFMIWLTTTDKVSAQTGAAFYCSASR